MKILYWLDLLLFTLLAIKIIYLLIFSIASFRRKKETHLSSGNKKIAILIPAYKEDRVIEECVNSCLDQDYPKDLYDVVVISDQMKEETNQRLSALPIRLEIARFENSTKAKSLNMAMSNPKRYDIALILDADNTIGPDFLKRIAGVPFTDQIIAYQAHRVAKNKNNSIAYLDAVSEEINNSIFRQGHVNLGLSSALIGSGMAFDYDFLKKELSEIDAVGGFDRALELTLFKNNKRIGYLPDAYVWDEKIQSRKDFARQRRRWLSAQHHYLMVFLKDLPEALIARKWDFCDKMLQQMSFPRIILLGVTTIMAAVLSFAYFPASIKWWSLLAMLLLALALAIPRELYTRQMLKAAMSIPVTFYGMFLNFFLLKGANKKFIHTEHGVK